MWDQARGRALAELSHRHQAEWHQRYQQLRAAHPTWSSGRLLAVTTNQQRGAHRMEFLELLSGYAGARFAGRRLVAKLIRHAHRRLQLAHPEEYQALYVAERARIGNRVPRPEPHQASPHGAAGSLPAAAGQLGARR